MALDAALTRGPSAVVDDVVGITTPIPRGPHTFEGIPRAPASAVGGAARSARREACPPLDKKLRNLASWGHSVPPPVKKVRWLGCWTVFLKTQWPLYPASYDNLRWSPRQEKPLFNIGL